MAQALKKPQTNNVKVLHVQNVYSKLQKARVMLQELKLKKSGVNKFSNFTYFELADFIPSVNTIFSELGLFSNFSIVDCVAHLEIINIDKPEEITVFSMPTTELQLKGCTPIQALGGVNTYCRRYLYLNALEIVESDMLDAKAGNIEESDQTPKTEYKCADCGKKIQKAAAQHSEKKYGRPLCFNCGNKESKKV